MRVHVAVFSIVVLLAASPMSAGLTTNMNFEASEDRRADLGTRGQVNCIDVVVAGSEDAAACPWEGTGKSYPLDGRRVLDARVAPRGPVKAYDYVNTDPNQDFVQTAGSAYNTYVDGLYQEAQRGENLRQFDENLPDVVPPGQVRVHAWYGWWNDLNEDGLVQEIRPNKGGQPDYQPGNEWVLIPQPLSQLGQIGMGTWIEPGSHPEFNAKSRPTASEPDLKLVSANPRAYWSTSGEVVFVGGSLLQTLTMTTVFRPILAPSSDGKTPFTLSSTSLVDIDVYLATAPAPIADLYEDVLGDTAAYVGSPGQSLCPNQCQVQLGPLPLGGSPVAEESGELHRATFAAYEDELAHGSGSSISGRHQEFIDESTARFDLLPMWAVPHGQDGQSRLRGSMVGRSESGGQAVAPGSLTFDGWSGLWRDLNRDRYIGVADGNDPYEGGHRPNPDNHIDSKDEFVGTPLYANAWQGSVVRFNLTLVPDTDWGPAGVYVMWKGHDQRPVGGPECHYEQNCVKLPEDYHTTGSTPIEITLQHRAASAEVSGPTGYWTAINDVIFPRGSEGIAFTVCSPVLYVKTGEANDLNPVHDCDRLESWSGPF